MINLTEINLLLQIDEEVIKACSKHMKKVCGDTLEKWEGANYKACANILNTCVLYKYMQISDPSPIYMECFGVFLVLHR